jgi:hypothetical protein
LGDTVQDGRIMLRRILEIECEGKIQLALSCEQGNNLRVSQKRQVFWQAEKLLSSERGLFSIELVNGTLRVYYLHQDMFIN